ncbi:MAG TPA: RIO1 family regulatory kinase/ATPase [Armatimonadota bacterium]|nr:RIO1 family regulatory kinase/ATPase [Armatimonadota bacterium]
MSRKQIELPESFYEDWWITEVLHVVKSGKEATVYCCRAHPYTGQELLAAKVYRPRRQRSFQNDAVYAEGRVILDRRVRRAVAKKTRKGREFDFSMWLFHEYEVLSRLHALGAAVPKPYVCDGSAILLEYLGEERRPAPLLVEVTPGREEAERLFDEVMRNVELFLAANYVHGDLSAYNILYRDGALKIIDFPQAVDPRMNHHAYDLLLRDLTHLCDYFAACGVHRHPKRLADPLWRRFVLDQLRLPARAA